MTLEELNKMITALENSSCTFNNCAKLASLYTCREYFQHSKKVALYSKNASKNNESKTH